MALSSAMHDLEAQMTRVRSQLQEFNVALPGNPLARGDTRPAEESMQRLLSVHEECSAADTRRLERLANRALETGSHTELTAGTIEMLGSVHQRYAATQAFEQPP